MNLAAALRPSPGSRRAATRSPAKRNARAASLSFWTCGVLVYGAAAIMFAQGYYLDGSSRDIWQHLASLRELIAHPFDPSNPFVPTAEGSRHFHPYWVATALVARLLGLDEWQALAMGGFVSAGVLLAGIHSFATAFYRHAWGPLALLAAMVLSWTLVVSHTGYHSPMTLAEGIGYPAALLIGLGLLAGGITIRMLERERSPYILAALVAFMFATHQLGALIALVLVGCLILLWPGATLRARVEASAAVVGGLILPLAWPYHSPLAAMMNAGNPTWRGGVDYYSFFQLFAAGVPSLAGLFGLVHPRFRRRAAPVLAALAIYAAGFLLGLLGIQIATRFIMPAVLMLHVGVGALLIVLLTGWEERPGWVQRATVALVTLVLVANVFQSYDWLQRGYVASRKHGNVYAAASALTADIRDGEPIAAYDVSAWPVVATGQRAFSEPWPEPMIAHLADRQRLNERLFDSNLSKDARVALARSVGVRTLIMASEGGGAPPKPALNVLQSQFGAGRRAGTLVRIDLY